MIVKYVNNFLNCMKSSCLVLLICAPFSGLSQAAQLGDVTVPDSATLAGSDVPLQLNGLGYRTKFVFDVYVAALYTESKVDSRDAVQALKGAKRVLMHFVYDEVGHDKMADAWQEGFEDNSSDKMKKLEARLKKFIAYFPDLKKGDVVLLDYIPATGTHVSIAGEAKGVIAGADFYEALLDVWLGEEPADEGLKEAMLGQKVAD